MRTALIVLVVLAAADVLMLALLLATVWYAHRAVRREAAAKGEVVSSSARDFRCLAGLLVGGLFVLGAAAAIILLV